MVENFEGFCNAIRKARDSELELSRQYWNLTNTPAVANREKNFFKKMSSESKRNADKIGLVLKNVGC